MAVQARRKLGTGGLEVSAQGLGCMGMSDFYGPRDDAQSLDTRARALELGIDFLDTAEMYGPLKNEELLGRFLSEEGRRAKVVLATKWGASTATRTTPPGGCSTAARRTPAARWRAA